MGVYKRGGVQMPTYMTLINYTQKGVENMKDSPNRLDAAKELFKSMGGELKSFYLAMGKYDAVVIAEGPDDETATKLAMIIGAAGAIRTETLRVFTEDEYRKIISELP
jgi:uncharacterized protein with GYD domain